MHTTTHIHTRRHATTHTYTHIGMQWHTHTHTHTCNDTHIHTHRHAHTHTQACNDTHIHKHPSMHPHTCSQLCVRGHGVRASTARGIWNVACLRHFGLLLRHYFHPRIDACRTSQKSAQYGVATISRLNKNIGLFCERALQKRRCSEKETYNFKEPTNRSHPIVSVLFDENWITSWLLKRYSNGICWSTGKRKSSSWKFLKSRICSH